MSVVCGLLPPSAAEALDHRVEVKYKDRVLKTTSKQHQSSFTHVDPEIFQTLELAQMFLQLGVDLHGFGFGVFEEGPELLQSIKLTFKTRHTWDQDRLLNKLSTSTLFVGGAL